MTCSFQIQVCEDQKDLLLEALREIREEKSIEFEIYEIPTPQCESEEWSKDDESCTPDVSNNAAVNDVHGDRDADKDSELENPPEIADCLGKWLEKNGVARSAFAKYIGRSKSHLTDMLKRPPPLLPKGIGKVMWMKMKEFLSNTTARQCFLDSQADKPSLKRKLAVTAVATTSMPTSPAKIRKMQKPAKIMKWQKVMLDEMFVKCSGRPEPETVRIICSTLQMKKRQVSLSSGDIFYISVMSCRTNAKMTSVSVLRFEPRVTSPVRFA